MSKDPIEVVRAAEQRIAARIDAAGRSTAAVDAARADATLVLAAAQSRAERAASVRTERLLEAGRVDQEVLRRAAAARLAAFVELTGARRCDDVDAVVRAVLPAVQPAASPAATLTPTAVPIPVGTP